jgi:hypothetical protein
VGFKEFVEAGIFEFSHYQDGYLPAQSTVTRQPAEVIDFDIRLIFEEYESGIG